MSSAIEQLEREILEMKERLKQLRQNAPPQPVGNYHFAGSGGRQVALSEAFGDHEDLLVIHNMGRACSYCTLWADGLNGLLKHVEERTACVLVSPDVPEIQAQVAAERDWKFHMLSDHARDFTSDMGFLTPAGDYNPGVSAFRKDAEGNIQRVSSAFFGPGDDFCAVCPLFDLLRDGPKGWEPS